MNASQIDKRISKTFMMNRSGPESRMTECLNRENSGMVYSENVWWNDMSKPILYYNLKNDLLKELLNC